MIDYINVIGAGLAGCEAAWQIAKRGIKVKLFEMNRKNFHRHIIWKLSQSLFCSNSLRSNQLENAVGLLKEEMRLLNSIIMKCADAAQVPAGGALAVDRTKFSQMVTELIKQNENIEVINEEVRELPKEGITIVATGPLTSGDLSKHLADFVGEGYLHFFDAAAPIVTFESIDEEGSRSKERYFSPRDKESDWAVEDQPPEFWNQFKTDFAPGTHIRIHPLLDWTELNIWEYIERENIPVTPLYFDRGDGKRYRSLGCYPCTFPVESTAKNVREIIEELKSGKFAT